MLIIQHGMETIGNQYISQRLHVCLNKYDAVNIDGYIVDFTQTPIAIRDAAGNLVYQYGVENKMILNENGDISTSAHDSLQKILELEQTKYKPLYSSVPAGVTDLSSSAPQRIARLFGWIWHDLGLEPGPGGAAVEQRLADQENTVNKIIELYNSKPADQPYMIINGSFTLHFIERFRQALGAANVKVISITRNISSSYVMHFNSEYPESFLLEAAKTKNSQIGIRLFDGSRSLKYYANHTKHWIFNMLNSIRLNSSGYAQTYRYEDILTSGKMNIDGIDVTMGDGLKNYNGIISQTEHDRLSAGNDITADNVDRSNEFFSKFVDFTQAHDFDGVAGITASDVFKGYQFPSNFFAELGYTPLTLAQILKSA